MTACGRALEAYRRGVRFDNDYYMTDIALYTEDNKRHKFGSDWPLMAAFKRHVEHTFEYELADAVIQTASFAGQVISDKKLPTPKDIEVYGIGTHNVNLGEEFFKAFSYLMSVWRPFSSDRDNLAAVIMKIFQIAKHYDVDLWRHIELNLDYNRMRSLKK